MMDREAVARGAGVIPERKLPKFLEYLVRNPDMPDLIDAPHATEDRLQGDILSKFPFCIVNREGEAKVAEMMVALLNNTCDLQKGRSQVTTVALAFSYEEYRASVIKARGETKAAGYLNALENNKIAEFIFVRKCPGFPSGVVILLDNVATVSTEIYERALTDKRRIASFTQNGFYVFLLKLANYYARPETPDVDRVTSMVES